MNRIIPSSLALLAAVAAPFQSAQAATYDAICAGVRCSVSITEDSITTSQGSIPSKQVTSWSGGGHSETDVATGAITTLVFGLPGLFGFAAKKHDYNYLINGYSDNGRKISLNVQFINDKPVKQFTSELSSVTGLAMNESRTKEEVEALVAQSEKTKEEQLLAKNPKPQCWSVYAEANPGMKAWANSNPSLAAPLLAKYGAC
jgi:hypothetical protein